MRFAVKYGGAVHESIGDGVVAVFGAPVAHEDDALRAALAADEMRIRVAELSAELKPVFGVELAARTGLNRGEVLTTGQKSETPVLGSAGASPRDSSRRQRRARSARGGDPRDRRRCSPRGARPGHRLRATTPPARTASSGSCPGTASGRVSKRRSSAESPSFASFASV